MAKSRKLTVKPRVKSFVVYTDDLIEVAQDLMALDMTYKDIAEHLGISVATLHKWRKKHEEFGKVLHKPGNRTTPIHGHGSRGSKYRHEYVEQARKLCVLGFIDAQMAEFFEVSRKTIDNWKQQYPEFRAAVKQGKQLTDADVADSLRQRAVGYTHKATDFKVVDGEVVQTEYDKHYPPDTAAAIFFLKNRQPELWRDKREVSVADIENLVPWADIEAKVDE